jgi:hypothetical protein
MASVCITALGVEPADSMHGLQWIFWDIRRALENGAPRGGKMVSEEFEIAGYSWCGTADTEYRTVQRSFA